MAKAPTTERRPPGAERAVGCRSGSLYARAVRQALPRSRSGKSHELHVQALEFLHTLPRRWPRLPLEQCRRKSAARHRIGQKVVVIRGSDRGGSRAAAIYSLIVSAKMKEVDP